MKRRIYFLFPDVQHVTAAVADLHEAGFPESSMHVVARPETDIRGLPPSGFLLLHDASRLLEKSIWRANLMVFAAALLVLLVILSTSPNWMWIAMLALMGVTLFFGYEFAQRDPGTHLSDIRPAIRHGEILLTVDVPVERVKEIEDCMSRRHAEAVNGGVGWTVGMLGI